MYRVCSTAWDPIPNDSPEAWRWFMNSTNGGEMDHWQHILGHCDMINDLGWRDLANRRRANSRVTMVYKITRGLVEVS